MSHLILVVDDEPDITALVAYHLAKAGYKVATANNGKDAISAATEQVPDLVVLDLMLPGISGYEVLTAIRDSDGGGRIGVILLTARKEEPDRIKGLELGADDYVVKPFSPEELILRVKAVLRRLDTDSAPPGSCISVGPIFIDKSARAVLVDGDEIGLTVKEYQLLLTLAERQGRTQSRSELLSTAWQMSADIQTRTVDMHVQRLRSKLGENAGSMIQTVRGFGYRLKTPRL